MKPTIKVHIKNLYDCTFRSDKANRHVFVVASSFGRAASLANSIASGWDDSEAFQLTHIHFEEVVVTD